MENENNQQNINLAIIEYFGVSIHLVWNTVKKDIPKLKKQMKKIDAIFK